MLRCSLLVTLLLNAVLGSPIIPSIELGAQQHDTADALRQAKSEEILRYMNVAVDPCEDFYEFVCGNYTTRNSNASAEPSTMPSVMEIRDMVDAQLAAELQTAVEPGSDVEKQIKRFYKACLSLKTQKTAAYADKIWPVFTVFEKMPLLRADDQWQESDFDWLASVGEIAHLIGIGIIFDIGTVTDFTDNSLRRVAITEPKNLPADIQLYAGAEYASERHDYINFAAYDLKRVFGVRNKVALQSAQEMLDFEIALAQGKLDEHLGLQPGDIFNLTTMEDMQQKYLPDLNVRQLITAALDFTPTELYVNHQYVDHALKVLSVTPKRVVANYVMFKLFQHFTVEHLLESDLLERNCLEETHSRFYAQLDNMLYRKHISPQMQGDLDVLLQKLKWTFQAQLSWMQEATRTTALEKLEAMQLASTAQEDNNFNREFSQMQLNDDDHLANLLTLALLNGNRSRAHIHERPLPVDLTAAASYSPFYSELANIIKMPVAYAQAYFKYSRAYPNAVNFATMGAILGHEMLHGFDDVGGRYDTKGNFRNWWDAKSTREFRDRKQCFIKQYQEYSFDGQHLPAVQVQAENVADLGGVRAAYGTYLKWLDDNAVVNLELETLSGLNYTSKQLFFISYGQMWCDSGFLSKSMATDCHAPPKFRVIGTLSNFPAFAKEFECPRGSAMNPVEKCEMY